MLKNNLLMTQLIQSIKSKDPQLFDALNAIADNVQDAGVQIQRVGAAVGIGGTTSTVLKADDIYKVVSLRI